MMVNESVEQSKTVADKYIEQCKEKNVSIYFQIFDLLWPCLFSNTILKICTHV